MISARLSKLGRKPCRLAGIKAQGAPGAGSLYAVLQYRAAHPMFGGIGHVAHGGTSGCNRTIGQRNAHDAKQQHRGQYAKQDSAHALVHGISAFPVKVGGDVCQCFAHGQAPPRRFKNQLTFLKSARNFSTVSSKAAHFLAISSLAFASTSAATVAASARPSVTLLRLGRM